MIKHFTLLTLITLLTSMVIYAQEIGFPFIRNYLPKEYDNAPQIWAIVQNSKGLMYFGSNGTVLEYDSKKWTPIYTKNKTIAYSLAINSKDIIYVGASNDFGYLQENQQGKKEFISLSHLINKADNKDFTFGAVRQTKILGEKVYFLSSEAIFEYSLLPKPQIKTYFPQKGNKLLGLFTHEKKIYAHENNRGLITIEKDSLKLVSSFYADKVFRVALPISEHKLLIPTRTKGLYFHDLTTNKEISAYNSSNNTDTTLQKGFVADNNIYSAISLPRQHIGLGSIDKGLVVISKEGKILQTWNESKLLENNTIYYAYNSPQQNLWIGLANGIGRSESSLAWTYWNKNAGLKGWVNHLLRVENRFYIATDDNVYYLENNILKEITGIASGTCWKLFQYTTPDNKKILLVGTSTGIYEIKDNKAFLIRQGNHAAEIYVSPNNPNRLFITDLPNLVSLIYENGQWKEEGKLENITGDIRKIVENKNGELWLGTYDAGVMRVTLNLQDITKPKKITSYHEKDGLPSLRLVYPYLIKEAIIFGTDNGFYNFNAQKNIFEPYCGIDESLCKHRDAYMIKETTDGKIWILPRKNKNQQIGYLQANKNGKYDCIYKPFQVIPQMDLSCFYQDNNGVVWVGGSEGLYRYDASRDLKNYEADFHTLIRKVTIGQDSIIYYGGGNNITDFESASGFDYKYNTVKFQFVAPFFDDESKNLYSYQLIGFDKNWSAWTHEGNAVYTNLQAGTYSFQVKSKNLYDKESIVASYKITILPPWYLTWWAYLAYIVFLGIGIWGIVKWNTRRLEKEKAGLESIVETRTAEIGAQKIRAESQNRDIIASINVAKRIQDAMLPPLKDIEAIIPNFFILFKPRDIVSGDFYWIAETKRGGKNYVVVAIADCTGHGVPGAFLSMVGCNILNNLVKENKVTEPQRILTLLDKEVCKTLQQGKDNNSKEGMDMAIITLTKNTSEVEKEQKFSSLEYSGAMNPIYYVQNNVFNELKGSKESIGGLNLSEKTFELHSISLESTTIIYLCSDGYQDQFGGEKKRKFMVKKLKELLLEISQQEMKQQGLILDQTIDKFMSAGNEKQVDDITIFGLKINY